MPGCHFSGGILRYEGIKIVMDHKNKLKVVIKNGVIYKNTIQ
jgi:hypothetical protein